VGRGFRPEGADFWGRAEKANRPLSETIHNHSHYVSRAKVHGWPGTALLLPYDPPETERGPCLPLERGNDGPNRRGNPNLRPIKFGSALDCSRQACKLGLGGHRF